MIEVEQIRTGIHSSALPSMIEVEQLKTSDWEWERTRQIKKEFVNNFSF